MVDIVTDGTLNNKPAGTTGTAGTSRTALVVLEPVQGATPDTQPPRIQRVAGLLHQAIDKLEQQFRTGTESASSGSSGLTQQAMHYQGQLKERIEAQPLQTVGIAFAVGLVLDKLLARPAKVRTVRVPARRQPVQEASQAAASRLQSWRQGVDAGLARVGGAARGATRGVVGTAGAAAGAGAAGTRALASALSTKASTLPLVLQLATERLRNKSLRYGGIARTGVQAHPMVGVGAAFGGAALVTVLALQRRAANVAPPHAYTVSASERASLPARTREMVAARPVATGAVVLGLGALLGVLLARR